MNRSFEERKKMLFMKYHEHNFCDTCAFLQRMPHIFDVLQFENNIMALVNGRLSNDTSSRIFMIIKLITPRTGLHLPDFW